MYCACVCVCAGVVYGLEEGKEKSDDSRPLLGAMFPHQTGISLETANYKTEVSVVICMKLCYAIIIISV